MDKNKYKIVIFVDGNYLNDLYEKLLEAKKYYKFDLSPAYITNESPAKRKDENES